jgi:Sec-independent protein translocase protein TatA
MGSLSIWHLSIWYWLIVTAVVLLAFRCRGMISDMMGDIVRAIKAFQR